MYDRPAQADDLVLVAVEGERSVARVALVTAVHDEHLTCFLCHSTPELAADYDLVIRGVLPYPVVVHGDLYLTIFPAQVQRILGTVDTRWREAIQRSLFTDGESVEGFERTALPLRGPVDPRWRFKTNDEYPDVVALRTPFLRHHFADEWD